MGNLKTLFFILVTMLTVSCTSLTKQGQEALKDGDYDKALSLFDQATKSDSRDGEAREGLRKAQQGWIERRLIDVRLLRLGNNLGESESLLLKLMKNQQLWQVFPKGAAFATQNEEIALFAQRIQVRIHAHLLRRNPLAAEVELRKNEMILGRVLTQNLSELKNRIYTSGQDFCATQVKSLKNQDYYTGIWLQETCDIWKVPLKLPKLKSSVSLFQGVKGASTVKGLSPELTSILDDGIKKAFLQSKWFEPKSQALISLSVVGDFTSEKNEKPVQRVRDYTVQIPYEETHQRKKNSGQNESGVSAVLGLLAWMGGAHSTSERVIDNYDGTETVITTKYRTEPRQKKYSAVEMTALKTLEGRLDVALDSKWFAFDLNQRHEFLQDRHSENFPDIGLTPSDPKFISDEEWVTAVAEGLVQSLALDLQKFWMGHFCQSFDVKSSGLNEREQALRCGYQVTSVAPEPLHQYYLKTWGITYDNWLELTR